MQPGAALLFVGVCTTLSACSARGRAPAPIPSASTSDRPRAAAACADIQLEAGRPMARDPFVTHVFWLDEQTLLVSIAGKAFERREPDEGVSGHLDGAESSRGYVVLDVPHQRIARAYRGIAPAQAVPRAGSRAELLVVDVGWVSTLGMSERMGVLDVDRGCVRVAPWIAAADVFPDATRDAFFVARRRDASSGLVALERWSATRLADAPSTSVAPLQSIVLAATQLVGIDDAGHSFLTFDPVTFAETSRLDLGVVARSGLRPNDGGVEVAYETKCTPLEPGAMALRCREGPRHAGVLEIALDPLRIAARREGERLPKESWPAPAISPSGNATAAVDGSKITVVARDGREPWSTSIR